MTNLAEQIKPYVEQVLTCSDNAPEYDVNKIAELLNVLAENGVLQLANNIEQVYLRERLVNIGVVNGCIRIDSLADVTKLSNFITTGK